MSWDSRTCRVAYQGGPGCNSERAGLKLLAERFSGWPMASFADAAAALVNGQADLLLIPVFNSTTGPITDALEVTREFHALEEVTLRIDHYLLAVPGARMKHIRELWAHPQVALQCSGWLKACGLPLKLVDDGARRAPAFLAGRSLEVGVLGPLGIGTATGLYPLEGPLQDQPQNSTTFRLLARHELTPLARRELLGASSA